MWVNWRYSKKITDLPKLPNLIERQTDIGFYQEIKLLTQKIDIHEIDYIPKNLKNSLLDRHTTVQIKEDFYDVIDKIISDFKDPV